MWYPGKKLLIPAVGLCFISLLCCLAAQAEPRYDVHNDQIAHGALEYSGVINQLPEQRSGGGGEIIIDDMVYQLADDCIMRSQNGRLIGITGFTVGMKVSFFALDEEQITKMWQSTEGREDEDSGVVDREIGGTPVPESEIRLENGVWTN